MTAAMSVKFFAGLVVVTAVFTSLAVTLAAVVISGRVERRAINLHPSSVDEWVRRVTCDGEPCTCSAYFEPDAAS